MPQVFIPMNPMNLDHGNTGSENTWAIVNMLSNRDGSYFPIGELVRTGYATAISGLASTEYVTGTHLYSGAYVAEQFYIAHRTKIFQDGTDRSGAAYGADTAPWGTQFSSFGPYVLATNRVDPIQYRDVTGVANFANIVPPTLGADPKASAICVYKNHVILGNIKMSANYGALLIGTYPALVWWSATDNAFAYGTPVDSPSLLGTDYKQTFDGEGEVVKLIATDSCVLVFKTKSIMRIDGPPFQISLLSSVHGTSHPMSVKALGRRVYFMADGGPAYVDIDSNNVVLVGEDRLQRAIGRGDGHLGMTFPTGARGDKTSYWTASLTDGWGLGTTYRKASSCVDVNSRRVAFMITGTVQYGSDMISQSPYNALTGPLVFVYDEVSDEFTLWAPHTSEVHVDTVAFQVLTENTKDRAITQIPLSPAHFVGLRDEGGTNYHLKGYRLYQNTLDYSPVGPSITYSGTTMDVIWPFKTFSDISTGGISRINRIKPIWFSEWETDTDPAFKTRVYTRTVDAFANWFNRCPVSEGSGTSADGWIILDNPISGTSHCICLNVGPDVRDDIGWTSVRSLHGIIVDYSVERTRSA